LLKRGKALTPIGVSYASLFERLRHAGLIEPFPSYTPDPRARSFDPAARCAYHSNVRGHSIESCRNLKREIERMIQENLIVIQDSDTQNIAQNPLPTRHDEHFVGKLPDDREHSNPIGNLLTEVDDIKVGNGLGNIDAKLSG